MSAAPGGAFLLLFLDGVGIGPADPERNPFLRARLPALEALAGAIPTLEHPLPTGGSGVVAPLDATLAVDGTPQSGTGQTSLLTGVNAAERFGGHFGPWTPVRLRPLLEETSLLRRALDLGWPVAFANAYPRQWTPARRRAAAPPLAARAAGLLVRHEEALAAGDALASEIVNTGWREHLGHRDLPKVTPEEAGRNLGRIAGRHRLTLYAHYATDTAGHRGGMEGAVEALERVDALLSGLLETLPADATLVLASDHGNVEDVTGGHTRNPVLGLVAGPGAGERAAGLRSILDVTPALLGWMGT